MAKLFNTFKAPKDMCLLHIHAQNFELNILVYRKFAVVNDWVNRKAIWYR